MEYPPFLSMRERGGKYDSSAPLVPLIQGGSVYHCISILKIARYRTFLASSCFSVGSIRHYFPSLGRQLTDRAGARHGNLTPPRISPSCPHCVILQPDGFQMLWTTLILSRAVAGQEYHYAPFRSWPRRVLPGFYRLPLLAHTGQDCMQDQL